MARRAVAKSISVPASVHSFSHIRSKSPGRTWSQSDDVTSMAEYRKSRGCNTHAGMSCSWSHPSTCEALKPKYSSALAVTTYFPAAVSP